MATYDWETQPEAAGAVTAFTADSTGMRWPEALGPSRAGPGEVTQGHAERVFLPDPAEREARREQEARDYDNAEQQLRTMFQGVARNSGADVMTAKRTAHELVRRAVPAPGISDQVMEQLLDTVEKAVSAALAGTVPRPRRPHRATRPKPDASKESLISDSEPEPASPPEETS